MIFEEKEYVIDDKKVILRSAKPSLSLIHI